MRGLRGSKLTRVPLKLAGRGQRLNAAQTCGLIWSKLNQTSAGKSVASTGTLVGKELPQVSDPKLPNSTDLEGSSWQ